MRVGTAGGRHRGASMDQRQLDYERLIAPMEARMIRTIRGIVREPDDARDALQDALAAIWRRWERLQSHPNPEALVLRMAINAAYDVLRRRHRHLRWFATEEVPVDAPDPAPSALDLATSAEARIRVEGPSLPLSRHQATALIMHAVADIPNERVARPCAVSEVDGSHPRRTRPDETARATGRPRTVRPCQEKTHAEDHIVDDMLRRSSDVKVPPDVEARMRRQFSEFRIRLGQPRQTLREMPRRSSDSGRFAGPRPVQRLQPWWRSSSGLADRRRPGVRGGGVASRGGPIGAVHD